MARGSLYKIFNGLQLLAAASLVAGSLGLAGCGAKAKQPTLVEEPKEQPKEEKPITATIENVEQPPPAAEPIYFDFDKADIKESSKTVLQKVAEYLQKNSKATVTISGHTDERGTTEYNLMLGDQRAKAAHDYLARLGIDPIRIKTISFGEERPAVQGSNEDAWSKNRRDEFNLAKAK